MRSAVTSVSGPSCHCHCQCSPFASSSVRQSANSAFTSTAPALAHPLVLVLVPSPLTTTHHHPPSTIDHRSQLSVTLSLLATPGPWIRSMLHNPMHHRTICTQKKAMRRWKIFCKNAVAPRPSRRGGSRGEGRRGEGRRRTRWCGRATCSPATATAPR
jgi:hypothetical protein